LRSAIASAEDDPTLWARLVPLGALDATSSKVVSKLLNRRALLTSTACALLTNRQVLAEERSGNELNVVVTGGHPGDPEYGCGGTIARYARLGHKVRLLYLNRGESPQLEGLGCTAISDDTRVREAQEACRILGATAAFAPQCNGNAIVDNAHYRAFATLLADLDPDVVFTHWPIDNHPDHRAITSLTYQAWNSLGRKAAFYYYEVSDGEDTVMFSPSEYVDITDVESLKRQACYAHASQSPDLFYALQTEVTKFRGIEVGYPQAEAFIRHVRSRQDLLPR
jgi:N-acetylglucosamine malate deacetylase 1